MEIAKTVVEVASTASEQSDRWLFVALLIIGLMAIGVLFRYFTGRLDSLQARMDDQTEDFLQHLKLANKEMLDILVLANATIAKSSVLLERLERRVNI